MKTTDFTRLELFKFTNKHGQSGKLFRVHNVTDDWLHCRIPNEGSDRIGHAEGRYSFSNDYLKDAKIKRMGYGEEPEKPIVYTKPKIKKKIIQPRRKKP